MCYINTEHDALSINQSYIINNWHTWGHHPLLPHHPNPRPLPPLACGLSGATPER